MDASVREAVEGAIKQMASLGAEIDTEVSLPSTDLGVAVYYIIAPSEASSNLARYDGVKYGFSRQDGANMWENMVRTRQFGFGEEVKRRIMVGTYALSAGYYDAYYLKAQQIRTLIRREFDAAFGKYDVLVTPVSPTPAFKIGEKTDDPLLMYLNDVCTIPVNIAGLPGISLPCGFAIASDGARLPIGVQILARPFDEASLFRAAFAYEQSTDWHKAVPALVAAYNRNEMKEWSEANSHEIWWRPDSDLYASVPNHGAREIKRGMLRGILKDLGLTEDDLVGK